MCDEQVVKKGSIFDTLADVESFIKTLEAHHHPLKIYKYGSVESYNKKDSNCCSVHVQLSALVRLHVFLYSSELHK